MKTISGVLIIIAVVDEELTAKLRMCLKFGRIAEVLNSKIIANKRKASSDRKPGSLHNDGHLRLGGGLAL